MQLLKSAKFFLLIFGLQISHFAAFSQKPPTGGPNPSESSDPAPYLYAAGGLIIGAGSYFFLRNRGPKLPVADHLPSYLFNRNILPTPDALHLMFLLNPGLNNLEVMRSRKKLVNPDFPEMSDNAALSLAQEIQKNDPLAIVALNEQVKGFRTNLDDLRQSEITQKHHDKFFDFDSAYLILNQLEKTFSAPDPSLEEGSMITNQLIADLLNVLNRTLWKTIDSKFLGEQETVLIHEILVNLSELLSPEIPDPQESEKTSRVQILHTSDEGFIFLASSEAPHSSIVLSKTKAEPNSNLNKGFAFAVYKVRDSGEVVTKGPEVEGVFLVKYVSPALKDFQEAYHTLSPLATYASAYLPPAKLFFTVEDLKGNSVALKEPLIDFKLAYKNLKREKIDGMIVVPILITP